MPNLSHPRYKDNPIGLFFEYLVLFHMGCLSDEAYNKIQAMNLRKVFQVTSVQWPHVITEVLQLSPTFKIAVLDLWALNKHNCEDGVNGYWMYAQNFADQYSHDDSQIDKWNDETMKSALLRVEKLQNDWKPTELI